MAWASKLHCNITKTASLDTSRVLGLSDTIRNDVLFFLFLVEATSVALRMTNTSKSYFWLMSQSKPTTAPLHVVNGKTKRKVVFCLGNSMLERRLSVILNCYCLLTTSRKVLSYRTLLLLPIPAVMACTTTLLRKCMLPRCTAKHTLHTLFSPSFDSFILSILMQKRA